MTQSRACYNGSPEVNRLNCESSLSALVALPLIAGALALGLADKANAQDRGLAPPEMTTVLAVCSMGRPFQQPDVRLGQEGDKKVHIQISHGGELLIRNYRRSVRTIFPEMLTRYTVRDLTFTSTQRSQLEFIRARSFIFWWRKNVTPDRNKEVFCLPSRQAFSQTAPPYLDRDHRFVLDAPTISTRCKTSPTSTNYVGYLSYMEIGVNPLPNGNGGMIKQRPFRFGVSYSKIETDCIVAPPAIQARRVLPYVP